MRKTNIAIITLSFTVPLGFLASEAISDCNNTGPHQDWPEFEFQCKDGRNGMNSSILKEVLVHDGACDQSVQGSNCLLDPTSKTSTVKYFDSNAGCNKNVPSQQPTTTGTITISYNNAKTTNCKATPTPSPAK